jgi:hypothetical protein
MQSASWQLRKHILAFQHVAWNTAGLSNIPQGQEMFKVLELVKSCEEGLVQLQSLSYEYEVKHTAFRIGVL